MCPWFPLETERLILREYQPDDADDIQDYASDAELVRFTSWGPNDLAATQAFVARAIDGQRGWPRRTIELAIVHRNDARVIGSIRLSTIGQNRRTAEFGYTIHHRYWAKGYATEATRAMIDLAFRKLGIHRVVATCDVRNHASYRVMEKLGMRREATCRKDTLQKGQWRDSYLYAVLAEEWLKK